MRDTDPNNGWMGLKVRQWHDEWDEIEWNPKRWQSKPPKEFFLFKMPAERLRKLSSVERRSAYDGTPRAEDLNPQRFHDPKRSLEIREYVRFGFPWSNLSESKRASGEFSDLQKPGWLPTAIVVNIIEPGALRAGGRTFTEADVITVEDLTLEGMDDLVRFSSPSSIEDGLFPIEIIDGQHRLWAFDDESGLADYEVPVVAFHGLDRSWQAYLFWMINIQPKRLNASLAFDLYPLLRNEDWLEKFSGHSIYRDSRAQELVEALWSHPSSPWYRRINMLGEPRARLLAKGIEGPTVSQSAWVRALTTSFIRSRSSHPGSLGGLFGAPVGSDEQVLPWGRNQQAGLLIFLWDSLQEAIAGARHGWAVALRRGEDAMAAGQDPAFSGEHSLLSTDQGIRGFSQVVNDLLVVQTDELQLDSWDGPSSPATDIEAVTAMLTDAAQQPFASQIRLLMSMIASFDWRASSDPSLSSENSDTKRRKQAYRGSGGYRALREDLLSHLSEKRSGSWSDAADQVLRSLR